jgi:hypothetical protein
LVPHEKGDRTFTDCEGRIIKPEELTAPDNVRPIVENRKTLYIDLRGLTASENSTP